jgi:hypothetical protein
MMMGTAFDLATMCGYDSRFRDGTQAIYTVAGTLIFDQRNKLAEAALNEGADYILWIDADMRFPKQTIERLLAHDKDIVGVNATTRNYPVSPTAKHLECNFEANELLPWLPVNSKGKTGLEKVAAIGCGVMLCKAEVFKKTPQPWFWFHSLKSDKILGEDVHFCIAAHDAGFETWVDHGLSNAIGHIGQYTYSWQDIKMALTNYSDLKTSVANYLGRSDLTSAIPDFITLAEIRLARQLRLRQMLETATLPTTGGTSTITLPADFLSIRDIYIDQNPRRSLSYLSPSAFTRDARAAESGLPVFYTQKSDQIEFAPIPDTNYSVKMLYYAKPAVLTDSNTTNVFMTVCPDALLYGALIEAEPYLMNDVRLAVWTQLYSNAVQSLAESDNTSEYAGVPLTMSVTSR